MPRLIDADELSERMWRTQLSTREDIDLVIRTMPTVDAEPVVRCKDCIHNHVSTWNHGVRDKPMCHFTNLVRSNEFYCGFGERREDADN